MSIIDPEGHTIDLCLSAEGAEHVTVALLACGQWAAVYATPQKDSEGIESPLDHMCEWTEFRNAAEREAHLTQHPLGERDFLVERHEHGSLSYALAGESSSSDRHWVVNWDVATAVAVLTVPDDVPAACRASYARDLLGVYSQWCNGELWTGRRDLFDLNGVLLDFEDVHGFYDPAEAADSMRPRPTRPVTDPRLAAHAGRSARLNTPAH